ncbi:MAG: hypothetical protein APR63_09750 [Desulfuromonas sp. SDB]|nr:MAG: hypothetical protein APR63_09750 [Desulfuromonas sp. SDB]
MNKVIIIDDDQAILNYLKIMLLQTGKFEVTLLGDSTKALDILKNKSFDLLLLDMDMPKVSGLDILKFINEQNIPITTIVLTGVEDVDLAISAMKLGTYDYLLKPVEEKKLISIMEKIVKLDLPEKEVCASELSKKLKYPQCFAHIITDDEKMLKTFQQVEQIAPSDTGVLIWGESGTGKELVAKAIHQISPRNNKKFVAVNAGLFANELFSSQFFGYTKGAFTGADTDKHGFIEEAHQGTLFLDEIGELSLPIQVKLLRFLQEGEFYRLGSTEYRTADVRIIAATNKNLFDEINKGTFRKDLFFRLNINSVFLPPLRDRKSDLPKLAYYFLEKFSKLHQKNINKISKPVLNLLDYYNYPGNVRELMNIINSAVIVENKSEIRKDSLPVYFLEATQYKISNQIIPSSLTELEKNHIKKTLDFTKWNRSKAAEILKISRVTLISKIKKYNLSPLPPSEK